MIKDCPVTVTDVDVAEKIFEPNVSTIKGKTTRKTPKAVRNITIAIPPELLQRHKEVDLCMDMMYVNGMGFLVTIDTSIRY